MKNGEVATVSSLIYNERLLLHTQISLVIICKMAVSCPSCNELIRYLPFQVQF